ncbi:hypothetical protein L1987_88183 [Smallanthus sonchifolius]|nr:hypothetical protein L1987_88183 [Smallanthus sonchifolius]
MEHLLYWSSALSRSSLSRKIIEYIMAFKRFLKVEMNTVLLHKNIGSRYYSQDRVHDPSRLLLVESIKKACDQCSDQFSITADEYDKMIDQIYAGTYTLSPSRIYVVKKERRDEKLSEILPISDYHYFCYEGQPGDMIVVAPDPKDIVVIIALTELLFDLCIYQKYTEEERVKSKTDEYKHLNRYHSNLIDMGDGQIECIGQFGVSVDIDTKNLIFHHQFDKYMLTNKKEHEMPLLFFYLESLLLSGCVGTPRPNQELQWVLVSSPHARGNLDRLYVLYSRVKTPSVKSQKEKRKKKKMRFLSSILPERFKVLSTIDLRNDGVSSTCLPFPVTARFPSTSRAFPSLSQSAGEGSSRAPLTSEDLPLLSQLRRDFIEGVPTEDSDRIGIINSTSAVPGAAERDALAVEAKKGIEVRLA